jgi:membrane protein
VNASELVERTRRFFRQDLWSGDRHSRSLRAAGERILQLGVLVTEGFVRDQILLRASALTYIAVLSTIPLLVVALAIVNAIGVSQNLAELAVDQLTAGSPEAKKWVLDLVRGAKLGGLGAIGAAMLFTTTVLALRHAEETLNGIWGVRRARSWLRRFADYLAVLVIAPLFTGVALSAAPILQSDPIVGRLLAFPVFELLYQLGLRYLPTVLLFFGFSFIYWFLPNTDVRVPSALLGGAVAAILITLAQGLYVKFTVDSARYDVLFGGFAALPLLLVWFYLSFAIFLLGAEVAFGHQNLPHYRREHQVEAPEPAEKEAVALWVALEVARSFRDGQPARTAEQLAENLRVSLRTVRELLESLEAGGIVSQQASEEREAPYQLGRPAERIAVADVLRAFRGDRGSCVLAGEGGVERAVRGLVEELDGALHGVAGERTLADLLEEVPAAKSASAG